MKTIEDVFTTIAESRVGKEKPFVVYKTLEYLRNGKAEEALRSELIITSLLLLKQICILHELESEIAKIEAVEKTYSESKIKPSLAKTAHFRHIHRDSVESEAEDGQQEDEKDSGDPLIGEETGVEAVEIEVDGYFGDFTDEEDENIEENGSGSGAASIQVLPNGFNAYTEDGPILCKICDQEFSLKELLFLHLKSSNHETFPCPFCDRNFGVCPTLELHVSTEHPPKRASDQNVVCQLCDKVFTRRGSLQVHIDTVHGGKRVFCKLCGKDFSIKSYLKKHIEIIHKGIKRHKCEICGKRFGQKQHLTTHITYVHSKDKLKVKEEEDLTMDLAANTAATGDNSVEVKQEIDIDESNSYIEYGPTQIQLTRNPPEDEEDEQLVQEPDSGDWKCEFCRKAFKDPELLKLHRKVLHIQKGITTCELCGKVFTQPITMRQHFVLVHEKERKYECHFCGKRFGLKSYLKIHVDTVHHGKREHKCHDCGKDFAQKAHLNYHLKKCTKIAT